VQWSWPPAVAAGPFWRVSQQTSQSSRWFPWVMDNQCGPEISHHTYCHVHERFKKSTFITFKITPFYNLCLAFRVQSTPKTKKFKYFSRTFNDLHLCLLSTKITDENCMNGRLKGHKTVKQKPAAYKIQHTKQYCSDNSWQNEINIVIIRRPSTVVTRSVSFKNYVIPQRPFGLVVTFWSKLLYAGPGWVV